jgi:hypothetical protein
MFDGFNKNIRMTRRPTSALYDQNVLLNNLTIEQFATAYGS